LSEFKLILLGENGLPVPLVKLIGMVFADNWICDGYVAAVRTNSKSSRPYTSVYPPTLRIENVLPKTTLLGTEIENEL
jgi:hypothetical protein